MGNDWCQEYLQYVKNNLNTLQLLSDDFPILDKMLKTYVDENGEFILTDMRANLFASSSKDQIDDGYTPSESPSSYLN